MFSVPLRTTVSPLDASDSRPREGGPSFSLGNRLMRAAWIVVWLTLASWTPRQLHPWRRFLLRSFGAAMGPGADVRGSARVWLPANLELGAGAVIGPRVECYNQAPIAIGARTLVSQRAYLCASGHDVDDPHFQLIARPITIGCDVWIAADAFVGPGAVIGDGAVLGARAAAFGHLAGNMIHVGNPAMPKRERRLRSGA